MRKQNQVDDSFEVLQRQLLEFYGAQATSRFVQLANPQMRAHVLEAGAGEPVVIDPDTNPAQRPDTVHLGREGDACTDL